MCQGVLSIEVSQSYSDTPQSVGLLCTSDQHDAEISTWQHTTLTTDRRIWPRRDSKSQSQQASGGSCLIQLLIRMIWAAAVVWYSYWPEWSERRQLSDTFTDQNGLSGGSCLIQLMIRMIWAVAVVWYSYWSEWSERRQLSNTITDQNSLKQLDFLSFLSNFPLEYSVMKVNLNQERMKLNGTYRLVCGVCVWHWVKNM